MSRSPGDTSPISSSTSVVNSTYIDGVFQSSSTVSAHVFQDSRPTYAYGVRGKIGDTTWIYPTPYSHYSRSYELGGVAYVTYPLSHNRIARSEFNKARVDNIGTSFTVMDSFYLANSRSAAQVKALNNISGQAANIGEDLATYAQTVRLFGSKAALLKDALNAFKSKKALQNYLYTSARNIAAKGDKIAAQLYLEYVYGLVPLVQDVYGVYQLLKKYSEGVKPIIVHGHGSSTQGSTSDISGRVNSTTGGWTALCNESYTSKCDLYGRVNPDLIAFRILNQLGLLNPASFVWEITPWSFVVDWFVPIGPLLNAFTAPVGLNFISGTSATKMSRTYSGEFHAGVPEGSYIQDIATNFSAVDKGYNRIVHTNWPFPTPYLNLNPLSGDRWLKALALAIVNIK